MVDTPRIEIVDDGKRRVTESDVTAYLFRELVMRRWIEDIVGEDLEEKAGGPGEGGLPVALRDGVRLCKLMLYLVPKSIPQIFEKDSEFKMKKNVGFFIEALGEAEMPSNLMFNIVDLYDQENFLKVLDCLEALGKKADEEWNVEISLKTKEAIVKGFKNDIKFTPAQEDRAKKLLEKCWAKKRGGSRGTTPTTTPRTRLANSSGDETPKGGGKGVANTKIRKKVKKGDPEDASSVEPAPVESEVVTVVEEAPNKAMLKILKVLYEGHKKDKRFTAIDKSVAGHFADSKEVKKFLKGLVRLQAVCRSVPARRELRVRQRNVAYRENVAREIHKTEADYIQSLNVLIEKILRPLKEAMEDKDKEGMVNFKSLFSDIQIIRGYQTNLMEELEPRIKNWTLNQRLGDVFVQISQFLKVYTSYVTRYNSAIQELTVYKKEYPKIAELAMELQKDPELHNQEINSFLIRPVQRIPRYLLLLKDLFKHTEKSHIDYSDLQKASIQIGEVAAYIEAESEKAERIGKLFEIQGRLYGEFGTLATPTRRFVKEGKITIWNAESQKNLERWAFLFNDLLLEAKPAKKSGMDILEYRNSYHLNRLLPAPVTDPTAPPFGIALNDGNVTLVKIFASTEKELNEWMNALQSIAKEIEEKRSQHTALVLERAKKKAQEAQAGFMERYKRKSGDLNTAEVSKGSTVSGAETTADLQEKVDAKIVPTRWESRMKEKQGATGGEERQNRWEKRLQAHAELIKARQEGKEPSTTSPEQQPQQQQPQQPKGDLSGGIKRVKRARKRAQTEKSRTADGSMGSALSAKSSTELRRPGTGKVTLRRKKAAPPPPSSSSSSASGQQEAADENSRGFLRNISASLSMRTRKKKPTVEGIFASNDGEEEGDGGGAVPRGGTDIDGLREKMQDKKERRRSFGVLMRRSGNFSDTVTRPDATAEGGGGGEKSGESEERRNKFRTASAFFFPKKKNPVEQEPVPPPKSASQDLMQRKGSLTALPLAHSNGTVEEEKKKAKKKRTEEKQGDDDDSEEATTENNSEEKDMEKKKKKGNKTSRKTEECEETNNKKEVSDTTTSEEGHEEKKTKKKKEEEADTIHHHGNGGDKKKKKKGSAIRKQVELVKEETVEEGEKGEEKAGEPLKKKKKKKKAEPLAN